MSNNTIRANVAVIRSVRVETANVVKHYHVTLQAARALRAAYLETIKSKQPAATIKAAYDHWQQVWCEYNALCRQHGILAAHS